VKLSLIGKVEVDVLDELQEGLAGVAMTGLWNDSSIMSQVKPTSHVTTCSFLFYLSSREE
jgi:hypothetical protein